MLQNEKKGMVYTSMARGIKEFRRNTAPMEFQVDKQVKGEITFKLYHLPEGSSGRVLLTTSFHTAIVAPCRRAATEGGPLLQWQSILVIGKDDISDHQRKGFLDDNFAIHLLFENLPLDEGSSDVESHDGSCGADMQLKCPNSDCGIMMNLDAAFYKNFQTNSRGSGSRGRYKRNRHKRRTRHDHHQNLYQNLQLDQISCSRCGHSSKVPSPFSSNTEVQNQDASFQAGVRATNEIEHTREVLENQRQSAASSAAATAAAVAVEQGGSVEHGVPDDQHGVPDQGESTSEAEVKALATELREIFPDLPARAIESSIREVQNPRDNLNRVIDLLMGVAFGDGSEEASGSGDNPPIDLATIVPTDLNPEDLRDGMAVRTTYGDGTVDTFVVHVNGYVEVAVRLDWGVLHTRETRQADLPMRELVELITVQETATSARTDQTVVEGSSDGAAVDALNQSTDMDELLARSLQGGFNFDGINPASVLLSQGATWNAAENVEDADSFASSDHSTGDNRFENFMSQYSEPLDSDFAYGHSRGMSMLIFVSFLSSS